MKKYFKNPKVNGAILATLAALSMSISMAFAKQLHEDIPTSLVVFIRSCFGLLFLTPFLLKNRSQIVKTSNLRLQILRVMLIVTTMLCTYYTYRNLPIAMATSIGMTGALFTTILSAIILKDRIGFWRWILVLVGYGGVLLVIRPTSFVLDMGVVTALLANIFAACGIISAKILSRKDSTITIMLYSNLGITLLSALVNINGWVALDIQDIGILFLTGFFGITTQFCILTALKFCSPSFLAPFEYTRMFFAVLISILIFDEIPNLYIIMGSIIIISSTYLLTYIEKKRG